MDTDFRMFSAGHLGRLPGIDLATVLDGAAYHTCADVPERLRPGSLQARCRAPARAAGQEDGGCPRRSSQSAPGCARPDQWGSRR